MKIGCLLMDVVIKSFHISDIRTYQVDHFSQRSSKKKYMCVIMQRSEDSGVHLNNPRLHVFIHLFSSWLSRSAGAVSQACLQKKFNWVWQFFVSLFFLRIETKWSKLSNRTDLHHISAPLLVHSYIDIHLHMDKWIL